MIILLGLKEVISLSRIVQCKDCEKILNTEDVHADFSECTYCGSTEISYTLSFSDNLSVHDQAKGKVKVKGRRKPIREFVSGDELFKTKNKWVIKQRIIDRENDRYFEKVVDKETDEVIHECDEPLSEHFGHGSAKLNKK